jgi:hypothetical protein
LIIDKAILKLPGRQCGRVVKAVDSKSTGVTRAGSNPAAVVFFAALLNIKLIN